jgi:hypothetical protein
MPECQYNVEKPLPTSLVSLGRRVAMGAFADHGCAHSAIFPHMNGERFHGEEQLPGSSLHP